MSMDRCVRCDAPVDTDEDLGCYIPSGRIVNGVEWDACVCERCREKLESEDEQE